MACSDARLCRCCAVHSGPATSLRSSEVCGPCEVCLPSTCPRKISLLRPACCDTCPPPRSVPDTYVSSCWLLGKCSPAPDLTGVSVITSV